MSERICPTQEHAPRRKPPDTARRRRDLPHAGTLSSTKASRHGTRAKEFAPRRNTPLGEGLPTRRTGERICPAQKHAPRRKPTDTAHGRKGLPRARTLPSAKASRHGARAKGFAPRRNAPHGEGLPNGARAKGFAPRENALLGESLPTRHTSERVCPTRRNAPLGEGLPTRRTSERVCPAGVRVRPTCRRTAGRSRPTDSRKNTPSAGSHPRRRGRCRVHSH